MKETEKILIADPQYLTSKALEVILKEKYNVIGIVTTKSDLLEKIKSNLPGLIIIEYSIYTNFSFLELTEFKKQVPHLLLIANKLTQSELAELNEACIESIILKNTDEFELFTAIESCIRGRKYYSEELFKLIIEKNQKKNTFGESCQLTPTEMEVVRLIAEGLTTKQIAAKKFLSFHTVMTHRKNIFRKTEVKSVSELLMFAVKAGWIDNIEYYI
jgi:DNA-binding NarL/FixJ family response regulator